MAIYSEDLRIKVVEFLKKGHTHREAAEVFGVCMKSICVWKKMDKEGKMLVFKFVPRSPHRINHEKLLAYVKEHVNPPKVVPIESVLPPYNWSKK